MRVARQFGVRLLLDSVGQSDTADTYLKLARTKSIDGLILFDLRGAPTAVFITSDVVAFGALAAIHQRGQAIPDEIAVVGFDDNPLARFMRPPLTTVRISFENMGHQAGKMLLDRIIHNVEPVRQVLLDAELIVRASSVRSNHPSSRPHTAETETP